MALAFIDYGIVYNRIAVGEELQLTLEGTIPEIDHVEPRSGNLRSPIDSGWTLAVIVIIPVAPASYGKGHAQYGGR
jgi:hypothetical protein